VAALGEGGGELEEWADPRYRRSKGDFGTVLPISARMGWASKPIW
jgi:hypothetical protein